MVSTFHLRSSDLLGGVKKRNIFCFFVTSSFLVTRKQICLLFQRQVSKMDCLSSWILKSWYLLRGTKLNWTDLGFFGNSLSTLSKVGVRSVYTLSSLDLTCGITPGILSLFVVGTKLKGQKVGILVNGTSSICLNVAPIFILKLEYAFLSFSPALL